MHFNVGGFAFRNGTHGAEDGRTAAHIELHHVDLGCTHFQVVAARIKGESLAHKSQPALHVTLRSVHQVNQLGLEVRALAHRKEGAHATGFAVGPFQHRQLQSVRFGDFAGGLGQGGRCHHVRRSRDQFAGQLHASTVGIDALEARRRLGGQADQLKSLGVDLGFSGLAKALIGVQRKPDGCGGCRGCGGGFQAFPVQLQPQLAAATACGLGGLRRGAAHSIEVETSGVAQSEHHQPLWARAVQQIQHQLLARFATELIAA